MLNKKKYWLQDEQEVFSIGEVESVNGDTYTIRSKQNQSTQQINQKDLMEIDEQSLQGIEDLLNLQELNEGNFLKNLNERYNRNEIYTCIGESIIISINPFKKLNIYDIPKFKQTINETKAHLYKITENTLKNLESFGCSQSIIISGESGSGKTESTKIILNYLSEFDKSKESNQLNDQLAGSEQKKKSIQEQIVDNNYILEAFGNAKTVRNDNSSRFGKFIKVYIGDDMRIKSANIVNYLLEKSRVTKIAAQERNYHIFYQMLQGGSADFKKKYYLKSIDNYVYLSQGDTFSNLNDDQNFQNVLKCLDIMKFTSDQIQSLFSIVSAILQLGNINIFSINDHQSSIGEHDEYLQYAATLLQLQSKEELKKVICNPIIFDPSSKTNIEINQSVQQAQQNVDSLCKLLYGNMFDWIVEQINKTLNDNREVVYEQTKQRISLTSKNQNLKKIESSYPFYKENNVGILDIFGFEIFEENSFEQLCINFANEKLQFQFNENMFKSEQKEYEEEGIPWVKIDFVDNKNTIDLFELKTGCIFNYLDDECKRNDGNDQRFMNQVRNNLSKQPALVLSNSKNPRNAQLFSIKHFAGQVEYDSVGFVDKNRDSANQNIINLLSTSSNIILQSKFPKKVSETDNNMNANPSNQNNFGSVQNAIKNFGIVKNDTVQQNSAAPAVKKTTLSNQFRVQLTTLISELSSSTNFYVRCIKPNTEKVASFFNHQEVHRQIKCAGLLEAIKIRKCGFSLRFKHRDYLLRYSTLLSHQVISKSPQDKCQKIIDLVLNNQGLKQQKQKQKSEDLLYAIGKTKIFLKEIMRDLLENQLKILHGEKAVIIQKNYKAYQQQQRYKYTKVCVIKIQRSFRYRLFRLEMQERIRQKEIRRLQLEQQKREEEERLRRLAEEEEIRQRELELIRQRQYEEEQERIQRLQNQNNTNHNHNNNQGLSQYLQQNSDHLNSTEYLNVSPQNRANYYNDANSLIAQIEDQIKKQNPSSMFDEDDDQEEYDEVNGNNQDFKEKHIKNQHANKHSSGSPAFKHELNLSTSKSNNSGANNITNINDVSEIIQNNLISSQKENEIMEILKQKSKLFCQPDLMSFSLYQFLCTSQTLNDFLQMTQIQIIEQLKQIISLEQQIAAQNKLLQEKDQIENSLERKLDSNILNNAIEVEMLKQEIAQLQNLNFSLEQENIKLGEKIKSSNDQMNGLKLSREEEQALIFSKNTQQKYEDLERENLFLKKQVDNLNEQLKQQEIQLKAIQKMNEQQRAEISKRDQVKMQLETSQNNERVEFQRLSKQYKKLVQKDKYNEMVIESVFQLLKDKNEELDLIKNSVKLQNLQTDQSLLNNIIQKQEDSLAKLKQIYKGDKQID
ncbi:myosin heavy chain (macronuclear) [Tetrahymena thermophila SB210]|uniref:Myosin heavy chain n=2 Tax=Tetrahymena thermophila TaxID=5911 RepID=I7MK57_TETTS|nr:myosin heavy chain [Tetrahymena thermophila SB210]EAS07846.3 myosin heavy chain [Tetrahymena thermophila SB210]BAE07187.1 Myosin 13 [Tetrahymena thermophila]|eukprot:XP_001028088.3 myosin heavy chain [Tetrahymena thermophila SB210]